jgi:Flp pilus assembly protein TadD
MAKGIVQKRKFGRSATASGQTDKTYDASGDPTFGRTDLLILIGLAMTTFAIYGQVIGHHFITLDDLAYIKENPMVNRGLTLAGIAWAFTTFEQANWHPLTWISHMIDSQLFSMDAGEHLLINSVIHVANALLVFWFLLQTTRARWPSALIAALFALHPLHVESVAWAAERKDTLSTLFGLLSLIGYAYYSKLPSRKRYVFVAVALALGLMAKPMLVTWPFVMLLLDYWPLRRVSQPISRKNFLLLIAPLVREKLPLFIIAAASAIMTFVAQSHAGAVQTFTTLPIAQRLANAVVSYAKYIMLSLWPHDLAVYYPFAPAGIPGWQITGAAFLLLGITAFCVFQRNTRPYLIVGWLWFVGTTVPVIGLVQVGEQSMADRYFYVPSIGLLIAIVFGLADIARNQHVKPFLTGACAGAVLLVLATLTRVQIHYWRDTVSLFQHAAAVTPRNLRVEYNLALGLARSGRYGEAAAHFETALQIQPNHYDSLLNMGFIRSQESRWQEAIEYYQAGIHEQPNTPHGHVQLALALWKQKRNEAAYDELLRASQLAPKDANIRCDVGLALARLGRIPEAITEFHEALRLNPDNAEAHHNLGLALLASGKPRESIPEFEAALRLKPQLQPAADSLRRAEAQLK